MSQVQLGQEANSPSSGPSVLEVRDLAVRFTKNVGIIRGAQGVITAVDGVSFDLRESEITAIVGESGSGKTTVANCIMRLVNPSAGTIKFQGKDVTALKGKELREYRRDVQMIYQDPFESLNPRHDIFTAIALPIRELTGEKNKEKIHEAVYRLLEEVALVPEQVIERYPHQLSGGQRQRVNIARALASNPKLLVADEPVTMLDAAQRLTVLSLLHELKLKRKLTVLMITHDLPTSRLLSERTMVMYLGKMVEMGKTEPVLSKSLHPYVELLMTASPGVSGEAFNYEKYLTATIEESASVKQGCPFRPRCKYAKETCAETAPPLEEKTPGHYAACHYPLSAQ